MSVSSIFDGDETSVHHNINDKMTDNIHIIFVKLKPR